MSSEKQSMNLSEKIDLNVGGKIFSTTVHTLINHEPDSILGKIFEPHSTFGESKSDSSRPLFFDRDPKYFRVLLNYLRTGQLFIDGLDPEGLLKEAEYFGFENCVQTLGQIILENNDMKKVKIIDKKLKFISYNFKGADLSDLDLSNMDFQSADFSHCILNNTNLSRSNCKNANFKYAKLYNANLQNTDLTNAKTHMANFGSSYFRGAKIDIKDFMGAKVDGTIIEKGVENAKREEKEKREQEKIKRERENEELFREHVLRRTRNSNSCNIS